MLVQELTEREKDGFAQLWKRFKVSVRFTVGGSALTLGDWRPVTDSGKRNLCIKLLCSSQNPAASLEDEKNLLTGYNEDEEVAVMPVSWVKAGMFCQMCFNSHCSFGQ
jgi:hypothetical protein